MIAQAALATLDEIEEAALLENVQQRSAQLRDGLGSLDGVREVRGRGLLLGAVLEEPMAGDVVVKALSERLVINNVRADVVRFTPSLAMTTGEADEAIKRFRRAMQGSLN